MTQNRHSDDAAGRTAIRPVAGLHACPSCDVTWRGDDSTTCWFCGSPGIEAGHARLVVEDENAA